MPIRVNKSGLNHAMRLVRSKKINMDSSWSFSGADGNSLLGNGDDWSNFSKFHLAEDTDAEDNTKARWKYPYGKGGIVYRRGVIAAKSRAAQQGETALVEVADELLNMIDKDKEKEARSLFQRGFDLIFGKATEEEKVEEPLIKNDNGFLVQKQIDGTSRWFAWVSNRWEDRERHIITDSAHREFESFLDENPEYAPELWVWHTPGTARKNKADWWIYNNGFFMYSGLLTEDETEHYKDLDQLDIGMSHGFYVLKYDFEKRHILKYRTFEVSELPRDRAANPFTNFVSIKEAQNKMFEDPVKRGYLVERLGEERVTELESDTEGRQKALELLGVNMKELEAEIEKAEAEKFEERVAAAVVKATEAKTKAIAEKIVEAMNPSGLQETIVAMQNEIAELRKELASYENLKETVEHLKETEDARIAEAITPFSPYSWGNSVTKSNEGDAKVVKEEDLSEELAEQVKAVKTTSDNVWLKNMLSISGVGS